MVMLWDFGGFNGDVYGLLVVLMVMFMGFWWCQYCQWRFYGIVVVLMVILMGLSWIS